MSNSVLVDCSVKDTLISMARPMLAGTFAMNLFSITDAWFVSKLGTFPLAAMSFAIPIVMLLTCLAMGLGTGITTLASHAVGRLDNQAAARLVSHGLIFVVAMAACISLGGYLSIDTVFVRLGAGEDTLPFIRGYMSIWYIGSTFMALPMVGNGLLIAMGDSRSASHCMILSTLFNAAVNPLLIFGLLGMPAMGIAGSALATVFAQLISTLWMLLLLSRKHRLLVFNDLCLKGIYASIVSILKFGIPAMMSMLLLPLASGIMTWILSGFGSGVVAAGGAAGRIEMLAFIIPMALGISLTPFVSQNVGANRMDRVYEAFRFSTLFALLYGAFIAIVFYIAAPWMAEAFSEDPQVVSTLVAYIRITSIGYGMTEVHRYCTFFLVGMHKPKQSLMLNCLRVLVLLIPLAYLGSRVIGIDGVFAGRLAADILAGAVGWTWIMKKLKRAKLASA